MGDEAHRLGPGGGVGLEQAPHRGRDGERPRASSPPASTCRSARPRSSRARPSGSSTSTERVGDLGRQPLLHLRARGEAVDEPGDLRQAGDPAVVARDVGDVRRARRTARGGARTAECTGMSRTMTISSWSASNVTVRWRDGSSWRPAKISSYMCATRAGVRTQAVAVGVLADRLEDLAHRALDARCRSAWRPASCGPAAADARLGHADPPGRRAGSDCVAAAGVGRLGAGRHRRRRRSARSRADARPPSTTCARQRRAPAPARPRASRARSARGASASRTWRGCRARTCAAPAWARVDQDRAPRRRCCAATSSE